jgi:recombination protein RecT
MPETKEASPPKPIDVVRGLLTRAKPQIQMALPRHITADRLIRVALTSVQKNPKLLECDKISLLGAIVQAAQLGLEPDGITGLVYLVPFWNSKKKISEVQLMIGYKGLMNLARRSGEIGAIEARLVFQKDRFTYVLGLRPVLEHYPYDGSDDAGEMIYGYAIAHFKDGSTPQFEVMTKAQIDKHRNRSMAKDSGPWVTDYEEMARKTVVRKLLKYTPSSIEIQRAIALDEHEESGIPQELSNLIETKDLPAEDQPQLVKAEEVFKNEPPK